MMIRFLLLLLTPLLLFGLEAKVKLQVNQFPDPVFGITGGTFLVVHMDFCRISSKGVGKNGDKSAPFMTLQHGLDDMTAVGP